MDHAARQLVGVYSERGNVHWELPLDKGILGHAVRYNQICNVRKAYEDPRFYSATDTVTATHSREVLCVPIVQELELTMAQGSNTGSVFAVLQAWNTTHQKPFTPNDQILAGLLTTQAGIIVLQTKVLCGVLISYCLPESLATPTDTASAGGQNAAACEQAAAADPASARENRQQSRDLCKQR